jgi:hypothetical protein
MPLPADLEKEVKGIEKKLEVQTCDPSEDYGDRLRAEIRRLNEEIADLWSQIEKLEGRKY